MLDLGTAFDTVNHEMMLIRMEPRFGLSETVLHWFSSYLDGWKQRVVMNNAMSEEMHLNCGVLQGSCLGPVLLVITSFLYMMSLVNTSRMFMAMVVITSYTYRSNQSLFPRGSLVKLLRCVMLGNGCWLTVS